MKISPGIGNIQLRDISIPEIGDEEVLVKVFYAGVCGTDIHIYYDRFYNTPPLIMGHEFSGVIEKVGMKVNEWKVGDRVVSENNPFACRRCRICCMGYPNMCTHKRAMGILSDGCFAEFLKLPSWLLHRIPDGVSLEEASLAEPAAVAVHAVVERGRIEPGDIVLVIGPGTIGLLAAQVAKASGARMVIVAGTDKDQTRLFIANKLGADKTIDVTKEEPEKIIGDMTAGEGVDMVVEASGNPKAIHLASRVIKRLGRIAAPGLTGMPEVEIPWDMFISKGVDIIFPYSSNFESWRRALSLISEKKVICDPLIGRRYKLSEWKEAFKNLEEMKEIKPIFAVGGNSDKR